MTKSNAAVLALFIGLLCLPLAASAQTQQDAAQWVKQKGHTAQHEFEALVWGDDEDAYGGEVGVNAVRVRDRRSKRVVQEIQLSDAGPAHGTRSTAIRLIDANFDGHPDLIVPVSDGGAGPNYSWNFYLFDPQTGRYVFSEELSQLVQPAIGKDGTITSGERDGCCHHIGQTFRYVDGRLTEIASDEDVLPPSGEWVLLTEGRLVQGKMHYVVRRKSPENW
jgi:hypothetical protein